MATSAMTIIKQQSVTSTRIQRETILQCIKTNLHDNAEGVRSSTIYDAYTREPLPKSLHHVTRRMFLNYLRALQAFGIVTLQRVSYGRWGATLVIRLT